MKMLIFCLLVISYQLQGQEHSDEHLPSSLEEESYKYDIMDTLQEDEEGQIEEDVQEKDVIYAQWENIQESTD
jgi:hypothetical protein